MQHNCLARGQTHNPQLQIRDAPVRRNGSGAGLYSPRTKHNSHPLPTLATVRTLSVPFTFDQWRYPDNLTGFAGGADRAFANELWFDLNAPGRAVHLLPGNRECCPSNVTRFDSAYAGFPIHIRSSIKRHFLLTPTATAFRIVKNALVLPDFTARPEYAQRPS